MCNLLYFVLHCNVQVLGLVLGQEETTLSPASQIFSPSVSATCRAGIMTIQVNWASLYRTGNVLNC